MPALRAEPLLIALVTLTILNAVFNLLAAAGGWGHPYTTFLFDPTDRYADWFKYIGSFPGGEGVSSDYRPVDHEGRSPVTNKHVTPINALSVLLALRAMPAVPLWAQLVLIDLAMLAWWAAIAKPFAQDRKGWAAWVALGSLAYPTLMMLDRGNHMAGIAGLAIVHAMALAARGRTPLAAGLLLALACNIRPNALLFGLPLVLLFDGPGRWRALFALGLGGIAIAVPSYLATHALYPEYSLASFAEGLNDYYRQYVIRSWGLPYGSSLYGAFKMALDYVPGIDRACLIASVGLLLFAGLMFARRRLSAAMLIFTTCAAYALGSVIFADYHLIAFLAVPLALTIERGDARMRGLALLATMFVLIPKNYLFHTTVSLQVLLNPVVLLVVFIMVLARAARLPISQVNQHQRELTLWTRLPEPNSIAAPSPASVTPITAG